MFNYLLQLSFGLTGGEQHGLKKEERAEQSHRAHIVPQHDSQELSRADCSGCTYYADQCS